MSDEEDFEEQLEQEKIAKVKAEDTESANRGLNYTDTDGTIMEWDPSRKAYFPKIDNDFIARYQMNYGTDNATEQKPDGSGPSDGANPTQPGDAPQAWKDFYDHYNQAGSKPPDAKDDSEGQSYTTQDYYNYYAYYYGEDYAKKWWNTVQEEMEEAEDEAKEREKGSEKHGGDGDAKEEEGKDGKGKKRKKKGGGKEADAAAKKKPDEPPAWFDMDNEKSTHVYVSGLPSEFTDEEFKELMTKCGLVMFDPHTQKPKLKLYRKGDGTLKGDGLCCYIKQESVDLALKILDGFNVKGNIISVEKAKFELKGDFDPTKKKKKLGNKAKRKLKEKQAKLFDWRPDITPGTRLRFERIVILKSMFDPAEFENDPVQINELRDDVRSECSKFGEVRKVQVYDHHADGVVSVTFGTPEEGDACVSALQGRWFAKRQIRAETYDGKTRYEVKETDAEREERLKGWEKFLQADAGKKTPANTPAGDKSVSATELVEVADSTSVLNDAAAAAAGAASSAIVTPSEQVAQPNRTDQSPSSSDEEGEGASN